MFGYPDETLSLVFDLLRHCALDASIFYTHHPKEDNIETSMNNALISFLYINFTTAGKCCSSLFTTVYESTMLIDESSANQRTSNSKRLFLDLR